MSFRNLHSLCVNCSRILLNSKKINNATSFTLNNLNYNLHKNVGSIYLKCNYSSANSSVPNQLVCENFEEFEKANVKNITIEEKPLNLSTEIEDVSDYGPATTPSYNIAAFVNNSPTLQEFVKLNVNLYKLEKRKDIAEFILKLDFEKNVKPYLTFLHDNGVPADKLGEFVTFNPLIFKEDLDNLQIRINYLCSKSFTSDMISRIITKNPSWLSFTTKQIDSKLGHFQFEFKLNGNEVRYLAVKQPRLITYSMSHIKSNTFAIKEEMGFSILEMKKLLLDKPKLFKSCKNHLVERFDYVHNIMKVSHDLIASQPDILTCRLFRIKQRDLFLKSLGRTQYDPKEPNYVPLKALVTGTDSEFCRDVAKTSVATFNLFQKTN